MDVQQTEVRWMGMIVGMFAVVLGAFLTVTGALMAAVLVATAFGPQTSAAPAVLSFASGTNVVMGIPIFLYGRSMFRRARTDTERVAQRSNRLLAWVGAVFSALIVLGSIGGAIAALAKGQPVPTGVIGGVWFVGILGACVRHLRIRRVR